MVHMQSRWRWDIPTRERAVGHVPDLARWHDLALELPERLEALVIEAMRHAANECGSSDMNPYECPHVANAMEAAFTAAELALPPEPSLYKPPTTKENDR